MPNKREQRNVPALRFPEFEGEWKTYDIGEILSIGSGRDYKHLEIGDTPVFGTGGLMTHINQCLMEGESVFIGRKGTINRPFYYCGKFWTVDTLFYTHSFINVIPKFVLYLFETIDWLKYNEASGVPSLSKSTIEKIIVKRPSIAEQTKIARLLTILDDRIATQRKIIEDLEQLKSAIRKRIFSELLLEYEPNKQIKDVLSYEQPTKYIVSDTEYSNDTTLTPVLTANKAFVLGYTEETDGVYRKGKCIILDDFTLDCKIVDFPFKVKSSAIKILTAKSDISIRYVYEYIKYMELYTSEHKRHYITEIEPIEIVIPSRKEMDNIARLFDALDKRYEAAIHLLQLYQIEKQYMLRQMFI